MKWFANFQHPKKINFIIDHDEMVGFYLLLYVEPNMFQKDMQDPHAICRSFQEDYLQDTLAIAQRQAFEDFGVPMDCWRLIE